MNDNSNRLGLQLARLAIPFMYALVVTGAGFNAASAQTNTIAACRALADKAARYACYDSLEQQWATPNRELAPTMSPTQQRSANPGAAQRNAIAAEAGKQNPITSTVQSLSFDREGKFTVTLANGQVWHQFDADSGSAHFRKDARNLVKISHVFWNAYDLQINDQNAVYRVERLK